MNALATPEYFRAIKSAGYEERPMSGTGTVNTSFAPIGSNLPDFDNYFCRDCRRIIHVRKGSPGFRACPTPGCTRPTGFGVYATVARSPQPRIARR